MTALDLLLSSLCSGALAPEHLADLKVSGLTDETITMHRIMSVPPDLVDPLLGFRTPKVRSAMLFPYPDPNGGSMEHVRLKIFPPFEDAEGRSVKYLGPRGLAPRLYFPIPTINTVTSTTERAWLIEGAKKSLAVAQLGLPAVGFEGVEGWHQRGSARLIDDFNHIPLQGRLIELVPDGDIATNHAVARAIAKLSEALTARGARPRLVRLPEAA
jgi:hypothetical protein